MFKTMQQRIRAARQEESGFTLIELLIVIVILGVLAGIVVFAVSAFNNDGVTASCKADVKNVEIASEAYYAKKGSWATAIDDATHSNTTLVGANYLKEAPAMVDGNGVKYFVTYTAGSGSTASTIVGNLHNKSSNDCA